MCLRACAGARSVATCPPSIHTHTHPPPSAACPQRSRPPHYPSPRAHARLTAARSRADGTGRIASGAPCAILLCASLLLYWPVHAPPLTMHAHTHTTPRHTTEKKRTYRLVSAAGPCTFPRFGLLIQPRTGYSGAVIRPVAGLYAGRSWEQRGGKGSVRRCGVFACFRRAFNCLLNVCGCQCMVRATPNNHQAYIPAEL